MKFPRSRSAIQVQAGFDFLLPLLAILSKKEVAAQLMSWSKHAHFQMITIPIFVLGGGIVIVGK